MGLWFGQGRGFQRGLAQFALKGIRNGDFVIMIDRESMEAQLNDRAAKLARGECPIELQHMGLD